MSKTSTYATAFRDLESPLYRMQRLAELIDHMHVEEMATVSETGGNRHFRVPERIAEMMGFVAAECREQAQALIDEWTRSHNSMCALADAEADR